MPSSSIKNVSLLNSILADLCCAKLYTASNDSYSFQSLYGFINTDLAEMGYETVVTRI